MTEVNGKVFVFSKIRLKWRILKWEEIIKYERNGTNAGTWSSGKGDGISAPVKKAALKWTPFFHRIRIKGKVIGSPRDKSVNDRNWEILIDGSNLMKSKTRFRGWERDQSVKDKEMSQRAVQTHQGAPGSAEGPQCDGVNVCPRGSQVGH